MPRVLSPLRKPKFEPKAANTKIKAINHKYSNSPFCSDAHSFVISGFKEQSSFTPPKFSPLTRLRLSNVPGLPCGWHSCGESWQSNHQAESAQEMGTTRKPFNNYMRRYWKNRQPHMQGQGEAWRTLCPEMFAGNEPFDFLFAELSSVILWWMKFFFWMQEK